MGRSAAETAQRDQGRRSSAKHQRSPEGRLDHCDRQRVYRAKCRRRVTQASSPRPPRSPTIAAPVRHAGHPARVPRVWARVGDTSALARATRETAAGRNDERHPTMAIRDLPTTDGLPACEVGHRRGTDRTPRAGVYVRASRDVLAACAWGDTENADTAEIVAGARLARRRLDRRGRRVAAPEKELSDGVGA